METKIKQVHFQITKKCNLRCKFCGQWGNKGFFSDVKGKEMTLSDWKEVISELEEIREKNATCPIVTVWGGEPLVTPFFDEIMLIIKEKGFETEVITNGVLIDEHKSTIKDCVDTLYVSIDGTKEIHDKIRGKGVFEKVKANLQSINHENLIVMSVITPQLMNELPAFLEELETFNIKSLYLQDMIGLTTGEIDAYKKWLKDTFDIEAKDIVSWENNDLFKVAALELAGHGFDILHKKHQNIGICPSPFTHPHIAWNGNVMYCTDFYDLSVGNVKNKSLNDIFLNNKSKKVRQEILNNHCIACNHCSWRNA